MSHEKYLVEFLKDLAEIIYDIDMPYEDMCYLIEQLEYIRDYIIKNM